MQIPGHFPVQFNTRQKPARQIPANAGCNSCHEAHGAVDTTFVQFPADVLPVAIQHATLSKGYLADEAKAKKEEK